MEPEYDYTFTPYIECITKEDPIPALYDAFPGPYKLPPLPSPLPSPSANWSRFCLPPLPMLIILTNGCLTYLSKTALMSYHALRSGQWKEAVTFKSRV